MTDLPTLTIDELAAIFRRERSTMERTWKRWRRDYGFPDPLPDQAVRLWSRDAVLAWIADPTGYAYCAKFTAPGTPERALVDHARQALEKKYASAA